MKPRDDANKKAIPRPPSRGLIEARWPQPATDQTVKFRDLQVAASLKHHVVGENGLLSSVIPRPPSRGLIEAGRCRFGTSWAEW